MNLIGNAIKHAGRDERPDCNRRRSASVRSTSSRSATTVRALRPEFHERIWGIFQTLESRDRVEGAGIGLALVKKIVESQRGRAWVESAPGSGATFRFLWRK